MSFSVDPSLADHQKPTESGRLTAMLGGLFTRSRVATEVIDWLKGDLKS